MDFKPVQKVAIQFCVRLTCMSWVMLITDGSLTTTQRPDSSYQCKKKAHVHAWRRQIRSGAWPGVCSLFLFVCLLAFCFSTVNTVFYCNVLRSSKKNLWCKMWYLPLCINSIYMEKAGGFRPCLHSYPPPYKLEFIQCYPLPQNKTEVMLFCLFEKIGCIPNVEMQMINTGIPQSDPSVAGGLDIFIIPH